MNLELVICLKFNEMDRTLQSRLREVKNTPLTISNEQFLKADLQEVQTNIKKLEDIRQLVKEFVCNDAAQASNESTVPSEEVK